MSDTIQQLEEKSAILVVTQEEKEVQEYLVGRHAATEEKIKGQALDLVAVADQQDSDLEKLHESKERKRDLLEHNESVSSAYQTTSAQSFSRMSSITGARTEAQIKLTDAVKIKTDSLVKASGEFTEKAVGDLERAGQNISQNMAEIDTTAAEHMNTEQAFLTTTLTEAERSMTKQTTTFQSHLTTSLKDTQKIQESVDKQQLAVEDMIAAIKQHVSSFYPSFI